MAGGPTLTENGYRSPFSKGKKRSPPVLARFRRWKGGFRRRRDWATQISGPLLDGSQVRSIVDEIKQVITASVSRKSERAERAKAEDFDAEEGELIKEENEQEEEVFDQGKDKTPEERRIAICIFDDVAEQCREAALKYYDTYPPFILKACNDENPDVRQGCSCRENNS
ncbi:hypothetical protein J1N35_045712 [Gossypium stocksii]|uniref:Uncharacterized protein n=1 Tax=Gossypium stocksii TaxID=47602 RepID=A0A9D3UBI3_9ROSI|nr:hypothetical protein J1N35_045712 [Gossypium stocksii]